MILIDGHNLIGKLPNISLSDPDDEQKLIGLLRNYHALHPREPIEVVFDPGPDGGLPGAQGAAGVSVRFARRGSTADAIIIRILRDAPEPRRVTVVTSDNEVRDIARRLGATVLSSQDFAVRLASHPVKPGLAASRGKENGEKPRSPDVEYWLQQFKRKRR